MIMEKNGLRREQLWMKDKEKEHNLQLQYHKDQQLLRQFNIRSVVDLAQLHSVQYKSLALHQKKKIINKQQHHFVCANFLMHLREQMIDGIVNQIDYHVNIRDGIILIITHKEKYKENKVCQIQDTVINMVVNSIMMDNEPNKHFT